MFTKTLLAVGLLSLMAWADRPNIIFLLADDQDTYSMGCYGNSEVQTPHLDQLSRDGITFDNHYNTTSICMASRANVMTGMLEYKTGTNFDHGHMLQEIWQKSYPILLRDAGYTTAFAGKFGFELVTSPESSPLPLPSGDFDRWAGGPGQTKYSTKSNPALKKYAKEYPHSTLAYGAFGSDFIKDCAKSKQPFCLSISFKAPHKPVIPDPRFDHIYAGKSFTKPANYGRAFAEHFSAQSKQGRQYSRFHEWNYSDQYDQVIAQYYQQIYGIDYAVGMLRKSLQENGVAENTIIIYTSDNGFFCGAHGFGSKVLPYEESARVPLIIHDPRQSQRNVRSQALTGNIDFAPTILDLAGLPIPANMDGRSLIPALKDHTAPVHSSLPLTNVWGPPATHCLAVVTTTHKYIYWSYAGDGFTAAEEVYDLVNDGLETTNLAQSEAHTELLNALRHTYDTHLDHWVSHAVPFHHYQPYGVVFSRDASWNQKKSLYAKTRLK